MDSKPQAQRHKPPVNHRMMGMSQPGMLIELPIP
jgi:hypothetical protein